MDIAPQVRGFTGTAEVQTRQDRPATPSTCDFRQFQSTCAGCVQPVVELLIQEETCNHSPRGTMGGQRGHSKYDISVLKVSTIAWLPDGGADASFCSHSASRRGRARRLSGRAFIRIAPRGLPLRKGLHGSVLSVTTVLFQLEMRYFFPAIESWIHKS